MLPLTIIFTLFKCDIHVTNMVYKCCVPKCKEKYDANNKVHVFKFPKNEILKQMWIASINKWENFIPSKNSAVLLSWSKFLTVDVESSYCHPATKCGNCLMDCKRGPSVWSWVSLWLWQKFRITLAWLNSELGLYFRISYRCIVTKCNHVCNSISIKSWVVLVLDSEIQLHKEKEWF